MKEIYIVQQGGVLLKKKGKLIVKKGRRKTEYFLRDIERIFIFGDCLFSTSFINYAIKKKIDILLLSSSGVYRGIITGREEKNPQITFLQVKRYYDKDFKLKVSKEIIRAKLKNYYNFLKRVQRSSNNPAIFARFSNRLRITISELNCLKKVDEVRGAEGYATRAYFESFKYFIKNNDFDFSRRLKYPPPDPVNAMLSYGYTLLYYNVLSILKMVGLNTYIGNLHTPESGRHSLALDLMEEYRHFIDKIVISMINKKEAKKEHFNYITEESYSLYKMNDTLRRTLIKKFENLMNRRFLYFDGRSYNLRRIIFNQGHLYLRALKGQDEYSGFIVK